MVNVFKSNNHFNEQVNFILLIMFLSVVIIITLKGWGVGLCANMQGKHEKQQIQDVVYADSLFNDSVVVVN